MGKESASFVAMGLMIVASILITFTRQKTKGIIRILLTLIAFILFLPIIILMLYAIS